MTHEEKLELMREEVRRLLAEYRDSEVCWQEMAGTVHLDPRLDLKSQVNVYAQVSKEIDGDNIYRYIDNGDTQYCQEVYGVSMRDNKTCQ
jgi:hypothetical protein